ncbi:E3 ubiquitin-protein [Vigna angularis]|uniref:E3 ubiquitin-protein n=1 Tax=Phaseolus angularis TaxID=3914 RepID=A0A8T0L1R5_PHAAN|nr:E3 ubiquitin-protein [Vigna angularis]
MQLGKDEGLKENCPSDHKTTLVGSTYDISIVKHVGSEKGNSMGCLASGERLVSTPKDGHLVEVKMFSNGNPSLRCIQQFMT